MKLQEIEIEFINTDYNPPIKQRYNITDYHLFNCQTDKEFNVVPNWIDPKKELPKHNDRILFVVKGKLRLGIFMQYDQWNRENCFCDGVFLFEKDVEKWTLAPNVD